MTQCNDLANDAIRIALSIAGYNTAYMGSFEKASALFDMAHELAALSDTRESLIRAEDHRQAIIQGEASACDNCIGDCFHCEVYGKGDTMEE